MTLDLNMSHGKMSYFFSFPLFGNENFSHKNEKFRF